MAKLSDTSCSSAPSGFANICNIWNNLPAAGLGFPANELNYLWQMINSAEAAVAPTQYLVDSTTCGLNPQLCSLINSNNTPIPNFLTTAGVATTPGILAAKVQAMSAIQWMSYNNNTTTPNPYIQPDFQSLYNSVALQIKNNAITSSQCVVDFYNYVMLLQSDNSNNFYAGLSNQTIDMIWAAYVKPFNSYMTTAGNPCLALKRTVSITPASLTITPPPSGTTYQDSFTISSGTDFAFAINLPLNSIQPTVIPGTTQESPTQKYYHHTMTVDTKTIPGTWAYTIAISLPTITINNSTLEQITVSGITTTPALTTVQPISGTTPGTASGTITALPSPGTKMNLSATGYYSFAVDLNALTATPGSIATQSNYVASVAFDSTNIIYTINVLPVTVVFVNDTVNAMTVSVAAGDTNPFISGFTPLTGPYKIPGSVTGTTVTAVVGDFISANPTFTLSGQYGSGSNAVGYSTTVTITQPTQIGSSPTITFNPAGTSSTYTTSGSYNTSSATYTFNVTSTAVAPAGGPAQTLLFVNNSGGDVTLVSTLTPFTGNELIIPNKIPVTFLDGVYTISSSCTGTVCTLNIPDSTLFGEFLLPPVFQKGIQQNLFLLTDSNGNWIYLTMVESVAPVIQFFSSGYTTAPTAAQFAYDSSIGNGQYSITIPTSQTPIKQIITFNNNTPYEIVTNVMNAAAFPQTAIPALSNNLVSSYGLILSQKGELDYQGWGFSESAINIQTEFVPSQFPTLPSQPSPYIGFSVVDPSGVEVTINENGTPILLAANLFSADFSKSCSQFGAEACSGTDSVFEITCNCTTINNIDNFIINIGYINENNTAVSVTLSTDVMTLTTNAQIDFTTYSGDVQWMGPAESAFQFASAQSGVSTSLITVASTLVNPMVLNGGCGSFCPTGTPGCATPAAGQVSIDYVAGSLLPGPVKYGNNIGYIKLGGANGGNTYIYVAATVTCLSPAATPTLIFVNNTIDPIVANIKNSTDITPANPLKLVWDSGVGYTIAPNCTGTDCSGTIDLTTFEANDGIFTLIDGSKFTFEVTFNDKSKPTFTNALVGGYVALGAYDGTSVYTITISTAQTIAFTNTTGEPINIVGATDIDAFVDPNKCLTAPVAGVTPYQIPVGATSACLATIGDLVTTAPVSFAAPSGASVAFSFVVNLNGTGTALVSESNNIVVTPDYTTNAYTVGIAKVTAPTITFKNTTGEAINIGGATDLTAFINPPACLIGPVAGVTPYQISATATDCLVSIGADFPSPSSPVIFNSATGATPVFNFAVTFNATSPPPKSETNVAVTPNYSSNAYVIEIDPAPVTPTTIEFKNTTGEAIYIAEATDLTAFINPPACLIAPVAGVTPYQISATATDCLVSIGAGFPSSPVTFNSAAGATPVFNFTVTFNGAAIPPFTMNNVVVALDYGSNAYVIDIAPAPVTVLPKLQIINNTAYTFNTSLKDVGALSDPNGCFTPPANGVGYTITQTKTCSVDIGDLFTTDGDNPFNLSFTQGTGPGSQERLLFQATLVSGPTPSITVVQKPSANPNYVGSGSYADNTYTITLEPPKIIFNNQTNYQLVMTSPHILYLPPLAMISTSGGFGWNTTANAFTVDPVTASSKGQGQGVIGWLIDYNQFTLTGTDGKNETFSFTIDLGHQSQPVLEPYTSNINCAASYDVPSQTYTINVIPATVAFVNGTSPAVLIEMGITDSTAFFNNASIYSDGAYSIGTNCTTETACVGTIGTILNDQQPVTFTINTKPTFTVDFSQTPPFIVAIDDTEYTATSSIISPCDPITGAETFAINVAPTTIPAINFAITAGSLTQVVQDASASMNVMYILGPSISGGNGSLPLLVMNFLENLSTTTLNQKVTISPPGYTGCSTASDSDIFNCIASGSTTITLDVSEFATIQSIQPDGFDSTVPTKLTVSGLSFGEALSGKGNIMISPNTTIMPETVLFTSQNLYPGSRLPFINATLASFPTGSISPIVQSSTLNITLNSVFIGQYNITLPIAYDVPVNILPLFKFDTSSIKSTSQLGAIYNMGTIGVNNSFSFLFALPTPAPPPGSVTSLGAGSMITFGSGSNLIVFNISGPIANPGAPVTGTICGATIATGSFAAVDLTSGTPSITISGTYTGTISEALNYTDGLTGSVNLVFER